MNSQDALANGDETRELSNAIAHVTVAPFVVHQQDIIETEALLVHVQEPHAHATGPYHQADELFHGV